MDVIQSMMIDEIADTLWRVAPRKVLRQIRKEMARDLKQRKRQFEPWRGLETKVDGETFIDASTFTNPPLLELPAAKTETITDPNNYSISPDGRFAYQNRVLHFGRSVEVYGAGSVYFSDDVMIPTLVDLSMGRLGIPFSDRVPIESRVFHGYVWMSNTPNEMLTQKDGIDRASAKVVVGGFGLGWFVQEVCKKPEVEEVVVVEESQDLLDWLGYDFCRRHSKVTNVICDDIYSQLGEHGDDATYLLDIWPCQEDSNEDRRFLKAKLKLGIQLWGWGFKDES